MVLSRVVQILGPVEPSASAGLALLGVMNLQRHEARGVRMGKWLHQNVVQHAKYGRGRPNPQSKRQHRHDGKAGRFSEVPQRIADILPQCAHSSPLLENGNEANLLLDT